MKKAVMFLTPFLAVACASTDSDTLDGERGQVLTFQCSDGFADCQRSAIDACGKRGFTEVERFSPAGVTTAGEFINQQNSLDRSSGVYSESVRAPKGPVSLTVRCN